MGKKRHYILGIERKLGGAFEHSWNLGKNLKERGYPTEYFSHWWDSSPKKVSMVDWSSMPLDVSDLKRFRGIFHLQTHTWENSGILDRISKNSSTKIVYNLHALIPYFYLSEEDKISFLEGNLDPKKYQEVIKEKMSKREKSQLTAMKKADYLFVLAKVHKKALKGINIEKPTYVFENVSDIDLTNKNLLEKSRSDGLKFREQLDVNNVILYCGRLYEKKGSFGLFDSFRKIKENYGSSKLVLLGSGEDEIERLLECGLKREDLEDIVFVSWIDKETPSGKEEFLKYHYASDVLVQPMITEGLFSRTVIDAMSIGLPTITCKSPYTIGTSRNSDEIFNSFVKFKENPKEVKKIIQSAKSKVKRENTWDDYISKVNVIVQN
jgi:glycosyltransferase involved in cell wall biosynthesis